MLVELLKPWRRWDAGHVMEKTGGAADMLIRRGIAKAVESEQSKQVATKSAPVKKAATKKAAVKKSATKKTAVKKSATKKTAKKSN